jgi:hypothetical protein
MKNESGERRRLQDSGFRFQEKGSRIQASGFRFLTPGSYRFPLCELCGPERSGREMAFRISRA